MHVCVRAFVRAHVYSLTSHDMRSEGTEVVVITTNSPFLPLISSTWVRWVVIRPAITPEALCVLKVPTW